MSDLSLYDTRSEKASAPDRIASSRDRDPASDHSSSVHDPGDDLARISRIITGIDAFTSRSIVDIESLSSRRIASLVTLDDGTYLFVKGYPIGSPGAPLLEQKSEEASDVRPREVRLLEATQDRLSTHPRTIAPLLGYFPEERAAVFEGIINPTTFREQFENRPLTSVADISAVASALARLHTQTSSLCHLADSFTLPPPGNIYERVTPRDYAQGPGYDYPGLLASVQQVLPSLRTIADQWDPQCLIHGDIKADNILRIVDGDTPTAILIDWELSGWGDPLWDVGCQIGQTVLQWLESLPQTADSGFDAWVRQASIPLTDVQTSITAFLLAYGSYTGSPLIENRRRFDHAMRCAGLFLIHRAQAGLEVTGRLSPYARRCLQVGQKLVSDPGTTGRALLLRRR